MTQHDTMKARMVEAVARAFAQYGDDDDNPNAFDEMENFSQKACLGLASIVPDVVYQVLKEPDEGMVFAAYDIEEHETPINYAQAWQAMLQQAFGEGEK